MTGDWRDRSSQSSRRRDIRGIAGDVAESLLTWCDTIADGVDDLVSVAEDIGVPPRDARVLSPPGFYAVAKGGIRGLIQRVKEGAFLLGAYTEPPAGAGAGESGIHVGGSAVRMQPDGTVRIETAAGTTIVVDTTGLVTISCPAGLEPSVLLDGDVAVVRHADHVDRIPSMEEWMDSVELALTDVTHAGIPIPYPSDWIANAQASSLKVKAG